MYRILNDASLLRKLSLETPKRHYFLQKDKRNYVIQLFIDSINYLVQTAF